MNKFFQYIRKAFGEKQEPKEKTQLEILEQWYVKRRDKQQELNKCIGQWDEIDKALSFKILASEKTLEPEVAKDELERRRTQTDESFIEQIKDHKEIIKSYTDKIEEIEQNLLAKAIATVAVLDMSTQRQIREEIGRNKEIEEEQRILLGDDIVASQVIRITKAIDHVLGQGGEEELEKAYANAIVRDREGRILFLKRGNDKILEPGKYCLPGGHIEKGESVETAVLRELKEEANLKGAAPTIIGTVKCKDGELAHYAECEVIDGQLALLDGENINGEWMDREQWEKADLMLDLKDHLKEVMTKAEDDELEKGGEGSRGGKVIGHTKSGKPIYDSASHPSHKSFTKEEHRQAGELHDKMIDHYSKKKARTEREYHKNQSLAKHHSLQQTIHNQKGYKKEDAASHFESKRSRDDLFWLNHETSSENKNNIIKQGLKTSDSIEGSYTSLSTGGGTGGVYGDTHFKVGLTLSQVEAGVRETLAWTIGSGRVSKDKIIQRYEHDLGIEIDDKQAQLLANISAGKKLTNSEKTLLKKLVEEDDEFLGGELLITHHVAPENIKLHSKDTAKAQDEDNPFYLEPEEVLEKAKAEEDELNIDYNSPDYQDELEKGYGEDEEIEKAGYHPGRFSHKYVRKERSGDRWVYYYDSPDKKTRDGKTYREGLYVTNVSPEEINYKFRYSKKQRDGFKKTFDVSDKDIDEREWWNQEIAHGKKTIEQYRESDLAKKFQKGEDDELNIDYNSPDYQDELMKAMLIVEEAIHEDILSTGDIEILKARRPASEGEERTWGGKKYKKVGGKWRPVGKTSGVHEETGIGVGHEVKVPHNLTTDPYNKKGQTGKVHKIEGDTIHVKFEDGKIGQYDADALEKVKQKKMDVKNLTTHAENTSSDQLKKVADNPKHPHSDAAKRELERRSGEEDAKKDKEEAKKEKALAGVEKRLNNALKTIDSSYGVDKIQSIEKTSKGNYFLHMMGGGSASLKKDVIPDDMFQAITEKYGIQGGEQEEVLKDKPLMVAALKSKIESGETNLEEVKKELMDEFGASEEEINKVFGDVKQGKKKKWKDL